jgi:hypothetical protein
MKRRIFKFAKWTAAIWLVYHVLNWFYPLDFWVHRRAYESFVQQVKASNPPAWPPATWRVRRILFGYELDPLDRTGPSRWPQDGLVEATQEPGGLIVSVITNDYGHGGVSGYIYSEFPLHPDEYGLVPSSGHLNQVKYRLTDRWWLAFGSD